MEAEVPAPTVSVPEFRRRGPPLPLIAQHAAAGRGGLGIPSLRDRADAAFGGVLDLPWLDGFGIAQEDAPHRCPPRMVWRDGGPMPTLQHIPPFDAVFGAVRGLSAPWSRFAIEVVRRFGVYRMWTGYETLHAGAIAAPPGRRPPEPNVARVERAPGNARAGQGAGAA